jgi:hypothetical protein
MRLAILESRSGDEAAAAWAIKASTGEIVGLSRPRRSLVKRNTLESCRQRVNASGQAVA